MKKLTLLKAGMTALFLGLMLSFPIVSFGQLVIEIQVSPNVLNLSNNGRVVTVHTDIAFSSVVSETVSINGIDIYSWKSDNRGNFVAKFEMDEIVGLPLLIDEYNELTLEGVKTNGECFIGTDWILVK